MITPNLFSILINEPSFKAKRGDVFAMYTEFISKFAHNFRSVKSSLFHGTTSGIFVAPPLLATNAIFERKSGNYIDVNAGYWIITMALMDGIICQWT